MLSRRLIRAIAVVIVASGLTWWLRADFRTPTEVVRSYVTAWEAGDGSAVKSLVCADDRRGVVAEMRSDPSQLKVVEIGDERIDGERAEVDVVVNYAGADPKLADQLTITLVHEGGWRICFTAGKLVPRLLRRLARLPTPA